MGVEIRVGMEKTKHSCATRCHMTKAEWEDKLEMQVKAALNSTSLCFSVSQHNVCVPKHISSVIFPMSASIIALTWVWGMKGWL